MTASPIHVQAKKLLLTQLSVSALVTTGFFLYQANVLTAASAACGGAIAMIIGMMLQWDFSRAEKVAEHDIKRSAVILYVGAVQRFFMIIALFACGIYLLNLAPLPMCVGFAGAQLCYMVLAKTPALAAGKEKTSL